VDRRDPPLNAASLDPLILDSTATVIRARATEMNLVGIVTVSTMIRTA
jgi:hypothetical protein